MHKKIQTGNRGLTVWFVVHEWSFLSVVNPDDLDWTLVNGNPIGGSF